MSILNQLSQQVDVIREGLMTAHLRTPDRTLAILDSRARYQVGVAGAGFSFNDLRDTPQVVYYRGADRVQAQENDPKLTQIIIPWSNMMGPVQFTGTELEEMVGLRTQQLLRDDYSLGDMSEDNRLVFINHIMTETVALATAMQRGRVQTMWGQDAGVYYTDDSRKPIALTEVFDPDTGLYGEPKDVFGTFEPGHPWAGAKSGRKGAFGASEPYKMVCRVWDFRGFSGSGVAGADGRDAPAGTDPVSLSADNTGDLTTVATWRTNSSRRQKMEKLIEVLSEWSMMVPGRKVLICDNQVFSAIAGFYVDANKQPMLIGNDRWSYTIRCVEIEDTYIIADPNKRSSENSMFGMHIGETGDDTSGSIFNFYWRPGMSLRESLQRQHEMALFDPPDGLSLGPVRDIPWYIDDFERFMGNADAVGTNERLKYMTVCTHPWQQLLIRGVAQ